MALPALVGLAALGGLITKVIEKVVDFAFSRVAKKIAVLGVIFAGLYAAIQVLFALLVSVASPLLTSLPPSVTGFIGMALPSNTVSCLSSVIAVEVACITYALTIKSLEYQSKVA